MKDLLLEARGIHKSFSGVHVLDDVHLEIARGEVHALMGENGAGKSTLIKIITGVYTKDAGTISMNGKEVCIQTRQDAEKQGIAVIYQELSLIPSLTVAQNILLGREPKNKLGMIDYRQLYISSQKLIDLYKFPLDATAMVESLSIAQRQLVEILKALSTNASFIIMDEPTASLNASESELLFDIIDKLRKAGVSILYISHRLEEIYRLSDRLTVLRDGRNVATLEKEEIIPAEVIRLMIGKELDPHAVSGNLREPAGEVGLELKDLGAKGKFHGINIKVHRGEILGIGGLVGSGRTELLRSLFGADPIDEGKILLDGKPYRPSIAASVKNGFGLVPEDRRGQGFVGGLSIERNVATPNYDLLAKCGVVNTVKEKLMGKRAIRRVDVRPKNSEMILTNMSGGNQQKVVLVKWLERDLQLLMIDEPTAGIDVGAKNEIYSIINTLADKGVMVILVSSDLQELIQLSHRILVLRKGRIIEEFRTGSVTEEDVLRASSGILTKKEAETA